MKILTVHHENLDRSTWNLEYIKCIIYKLIYKLLMYECKRSLIKLFFLHVQKSRQKLEYLENEKSI